MYLVGADPEIFVKDTTNGQFVCAEGIVAGNKKNPYKVDCGAFQIDGTALEFNIDPADSRVAFIGNVRTVYSLLADAVHVFDHNLQLAPVPVADYDEEYFYTKISNKAKELGCDPDYCAYTGEANPRPDGERPFRTASGHVHIGFCGTNDSFDPGHYGACCVVAKQLDFFLGLPSLIWDKDNRRRSMYGKAGAFRPKRYGLEYRTLSNAWLRSEYLMGYVFDGVQAAMAALDRGDILDDRFPGLAQQIIDGNITDWFDTYGDITGRGLPTLEDFQ